MPLGRNRKDASERKGSFIAIPEEAVYDAGVRYEDLVGAADAVVTKPGYGIVSEAIANDTAMLYTARGHFPEYDVIVRELPQYVRSAFIDNNDLFAGSGSRTWTAAGAAEGEEEGDTTVRRWRRNLVKTLDKPPKRPRGRARRARTVVRFRTRRSS